MAKFLIFYTFLTLTFSCNKSKVTSAKTGVKAEHAADLSVEEDVLSKKPKPAKNYPNKDQGKNPDGKFAPLELDSVVIVNPTDEVQTYEKKIIVEWEKAISKYEGIRYESLICSSPNCDKCLQEGYGNLVRSSLNSREISLVELVPVYICVRPILSSPNQNSVASWDNSPKIERFIEPKQIIVSDIVELKLDTPVGTTVGIVNLDVEPITAFNFVGTDLNDQDNYLIVEKDRVILNSSLKEFTGTSILTKITASNAEGRSIEKILIFDVGNAETAPTALDLYEKSFDENKIVTANFIVTDNVGDSHTFELVGEKNDNEHFSIEGNSLVSNKSFNFEEKNKYVVKVRVTDIDGYTYEQDLTINIVDVNEAPTDLKLVVLEGASDGIFAANDKIFAIEVIDDDINNNYTFALKSVGIKPGHVFRGHENFINFTDYSNVISTLKNWRISRFFVEVEVFDHNVLDVKNTFIKTLFYENEKISNTGLPEKCADILQDLFIPTEVGLDGKYWVFHGRDKDKPWQVYCADMGIRQPVDYLNINGSKNNSMYVSGQGQGSLKTIYNKIKLDPLSLKIDAKDARYIESVNTLNGSLYQEFLSGQDIPYGVALACAAQSTAQMHIGSTPFYLEGNFKGGVATASNNNQTFELRVEGASECSFVSTNEQIKINNLKFSQPNGVTEEDPNLEVNYFIQLKYDSNLLPDKTLR